MEQTINIEELVQDDHNLNKGTREGQRLMERSFKELGAGRSILVDKDGRIIAGNKSQKAAMAAGIRKVRVIETQGDELIAVKRTDLSLDSKEGRELAYADNLTTQVNLAWDEIELDHLQTEVEGFDTSDWGFDAKQLAGLEPIVPKGAEVAKEEPKAVEEDEFDEQKDSVPTVCALGDVWLLGEHRLMCGDSTKAENYDTLLNGESAMLCLTDPPYGIDADKGVGGFGSAGDKARKYEGNWDATTPDKAAYDLFLSKAKHSIVWGGNYMTDKLPVGKHWIVWNKVGNIDFKNPYSDCELAWTNIDKKSVKMYTVVSQGFVQEDKDERLHPTQKSVKMLAMVLADYSAENDIILDCFGGSGSTLIACEQLGRKARLMELDPHYCDVIIARWEKLTGKKAVRVEK